MKTNLTIEQVRQLSSTDLRTTASELKIKNYTRLTKDQLQRKVIEAIQLQASKVPSEEQHDTIVAELQSTINSESEKEVITTVTLKTMVEATIEGFIAAKQTTLYIKAMETLGGSYDSDFDDLLENASAEALEAVLAITVPPVDTVDVTSTSKKEKVANNQAAPRSGSKSEKIYQYLLANPEMALSKVAQLFDTHYPMVSRIKNIYIKK
jgi:hypothetical protein